MPSQIDKLEAHCGVLLDRMLALKESYSMLEPMLFNQQVVDAWGKGERYRGFNHLQLTLYVHCCQEIAKLCVDTDDRVPSIKNVATKIADEKLRDKLRENYAVRPTLSEPGQSDPEISEALERLGLRDQLERYAQFDDYYQQFKHGWSRLQASAELKSIVIVRDKVSAHTEVRFGADKYSPYTLNDVKLKWGDPRKLIADVQKLVELIGFLVRRAGFAWEMLDENLVKASSSFWGFSLPTK